jgi:thiol-disulfide isomerase/thioredoxin
VNCSTKALCAVLVFVAVSGCDGRAPIDIELPRPDGKSAKPFETTNAVVAFIFVSTECPISNRYAPEVQRLQEKFGKVGFWLVYPNASDSDEEIRKHLQEFRHTAPALCDPKHKLVRLAGVRVTPEAAVFNSRGELLYHGRIDDRHVDFGKQRPEPTRRDLENALSAVLNGQAPQKAAGPSVGCPIQ